MSIALRYSRVLQFTAAAVALACGTALLAQEQPTQTPATAVPLASPTLPGIDPARTAPFAFQDVPVATILADMSQRFGFVVISTTLPDKRVTIHPSKELTAEEAIRTLNALLAPMGYVAVVSNTTPPSGKGGSTVLRVVTAAEGIKSHMPVISGSDPNNIPVSDALRTQIIPLQNITAVGLLNELRPLIGGSADATADPVSNSIIITDTAAKIHRIVEIVHSLDSTPRPRAAYQMRQLQNAKAADAAQLINAMFTAQPSATPGPTGGVGSVISGANTNAAGPARGSGSTAMATHFYAGADARTNMVILTGPEDQVVMAMEMLARIDAVSTQDLDTAIFLLKRLDYANGQDITPVLNQIFGNGTGTGTASASTSQGLTMNRTNGGGVGGTGSANRGGSGAAPARGGLGRAGS